MPTPIENRTTPDLLENQLGLYVTGTNGQAILAELITRIIKEGDYDDTTTNRGFVRPSHPNPNG